MERTDFQRYLPGVFVGLVCAILALLCTEQWLIAIILGVGATVLTLQIFRSIVQERLSSERKAILELLDDVRPLLASGESFAAALASVARRGQHPAVKALAGALDVVAAGVYRPGSASSPVGWPLANLLFQLTLFHRAQGGDPGAMVASLSTRLELTAELARRRELALIQIQWQANAITLIFGLILLAGIIRAGPFITMLVETVEGRSFVGVSASLVIWGRVVLNRLAEQLE